jgi:glycerate dehydrogenase
MASQPPLIVFLDEESFPSAVRIRPPASPHRWRAYGRSTLSEVAERIADAAVVITNKVRIDAAAMSAAPRLKLIAVAATGMDNIDLAAAEARAITVRNVSGYAMTAVAEHAMMLMLVLARRLEAHRAAVRDGTWSASAQFCVFAAPMVELSGLTLGLVGSGAIAEALAQRAQAFGMRILRAERRGAAVIRPGRTDFMTVLGEADVLSLHCPLTEATRGLMNAETFAATKAGQILINTARGALVDEAALEAALESGHLAGAGLDVAEREPPPPGAPIVRLAMREDVIVTPHVAWASRAAVQALADKVTENIERFLSRA